MNDSFEQELITHDQAVDAAGIAIWVGAEPTFTPRFSDASEWLSEALGAEKPKLALRLTAALRSRHPGAVVLRTLGRQYAEEPEPRWSLGLYERRDGESLWAGPPDPLSEPPDDPLPVDSERLAQFCDALAKGLAEKGWKAAVVDADATADWRVVACPDGDTPPTDPAEESRLGRDSVHLGPIPRDGLDDDLAADGIHLFVIDVPDKGPCAQSVCVELPAFASVDHFLDCLDVLGRGAVRAQLPALIVRGFPPPVDARIAWTTITPDPAVIEINQAPYPSGVQFLAAMRELHTVAAETGLASFRLQYNGTVSDSGGGGQFTLGGPSPEASPFFVAPDLLPRLIRYLNQHPALSYLFAPDYVGGSSQSPRTDEGICHRFEELDLALDLLAQAPEVTPESLWRGLSQFLTDPSGNPHRSELNIEKLWNPYLHGRGCLGLVEFRAFRMSMTPERAAAIAALLRAVSAMLATRDKAPGLKEWGETLHDRFALPFYLRQDLHLVFNDLGASGLGLGEGIEEVLCNDPGRARWAVEFEGCHLEIEPAVEFWPLVGDVASQEGGGSRLVDASTARLQVTLRSAGGGAPPIDGWQLLVKGYEIPLRRDHDPSGVVRVRGLRYRDFVPWTGLHPALPAEGPVILALTHPAVDEALRLTLHNWRPDETPYAGLPEDLDDAAVRRAERLVVERVPRADLFPVDTPPDNALSAYCVDLRRL